MSQQRLTHIIQSDQIDEQSSAKNYQKYLQRKKGIQKADEVVRRMESNLQKYRREESEYEGTSEADYIEELQNRLAVCERELIAERNKNTLLQKTVDRLKQQAQNQSKQQPGAMKLALSKKTEQVMLLERRQRALQSRNVILEKALRQQLELVSQL